MAQQHTDTWNDPSSTDQTPLKVPFIIRIAFPPESDPSGSADDMPPAMSAAQRSAYCKALKREIASAEGDAEGAKIALVIFEGSPTDIHLDHWTELMDELEHSFPSTRSAHIRFDTTPQGVTSKAMAYASRYHSLMNMAVTPDNSCLKPASDLLARATREHFADYGFTVLPHINGIGSDSASGESSDLMAWLDHALQLHPAFFNFSCEGIFGIPENMPHGSDPVAPEVASYLEAKSYKAVAPSLFALHSKYHIWFEHDAKAQTAGFGVGTVSDYGGMSFMTTRDVNLYIEQAGLSSAIYQQVSVNT